MAGSKLDTVISSTITYLENPPTQWIVLSSSATLVVGRAPSHGEHGPISSAVRLRSENAVGAQAAVSLLS